MTGASCAPDQLVRHRRLGEAHGDRKVDGGGAKPLAPTSPITGCERNRSCRTANRPSSQAFSFGCGWTATISAPSTSNRDAEQRAPHARRCGPEAADAGDAQLQPVDIDVGAAVGPLPRGAHPFSDADLVGRRGGFQASTSALRSLGRRMATATLPFGSGRASFTGHHDLHSCAPASHGPGGMFTHVVDKRGRHRDRRSRQRRARRDGPAPGTRRERDRQSS